MASTFGPRLWRRSTASVPPARSLGRRMTVHAAAALIVLALIGWVILDHRAQTRHLRDLEARGVSRRSARQAGKPS